MPEFSRGLIWLENIEGLNFVPENFGKKIMAEFMKWRAQPGRPKYSFPANGLVVFFLRPFLQFGQNKTENKENSEKSRQLDRSYFEQGNKKNLHIFIV